METELSLNYTQVFSVLSELVEIGLVVMNPSGEMDFASERARELLGCERELAVHACPKDIQTALQEIVRGVVSGAAPSVQKSASFEVGGEERDLMLEGHPIDETHCAGVLILVKDALNMRRMAQDIRMSAQFRNTRRLYHSVVHDLRQPISAVMLHIDLLRDRLPADESDGKSHPAANSLRVIKKQVEDLSRALTLLLEEIQPSEVEERGFSLVEVLEDTMRLVAPQAAHEDVEVHLVTDNHAGRMSGSRQRIKQALLNMAVNALDAMSDGGTLKVAMKVVGNEAIVTLEDTGIGIKPEALGRIFEMHYTTKSAGTGVGLFVARDVIERHGGRIEVDTEVGRGTTFRVILPVSTNGS